MLSLDNPKVKAIGVLSLLFALGLVLYPTSAGLILILSLLVLGGLVLLWKEADVKLVGLAALVLLALLNMALHGLQFGIDFSGGTRIPIVLEHPVDQTTLGELVQTIKKRVSVLGLSGDRVYAVGNSEIYVEVPGEGQPRLAFIEDTLSHQGVFQAVIEQRIALRGEDLFAASISPVSSTQLSPGSDWGVEFSLTEEGAERFAQAARGQAYAPLYMFLDRPSNTAIFIDLAHVRQNAPSGIAEATLVDTLNRSIQIENDPLPLYILDTLDVSGLPNGSNRTAIVPNNLSMEIRTGLEGKGYVLRTVDTEILAPEYASLPQGRMALDRWEAAGLLSMAVLQPSVTQGTPLRSASITGGTGATDSTSRARLAEENVKRIESILKGGALPVAISIGSRTVVPPTLGQQFLHFSLVAIAVALLAISIFIGIRYRHPRIILPIVLISISELIILLSILGSFGIDLIHMAGIIAAIGVGVDAQIIITDELLKKMGTIKDRLQYAFRIIQTNVTVAVVAMLPLLFSGLVEIIGFATATILGALLGFLLSRPAYAVLAEKILGEDSA